MYRIRHRFVPCRYKSTTNNNVAQSLPVMVFGSSTDVGKTIVSTGLCLAALNSLRKVCYFKPVQTGELDEYFIRLYANPQGTSDIFFRTLHHWTPATSPHVAAKLSDPNGNNKVVSDEELVTGLNREIKAFVATSNSVNTFSIVETAGGVLSPGPSKSLQADIYRTLRLPVILVGDSKLGGITSTLCAYESLRLRGYRVSAIVIISKPGTDLYGNIPYLQEHLKKTFTNSSTQIPGVYSLSPLPQGLLHDWFLENSNTFQQLFSQLETSTIEEMKGLEQMYNDGMNCVWLPENVSKQNVVMIESAYGEYFRTLKPKSDKEVNNRLVNTYDGIGSYWTQGIGHGNSSMATVIAEAAGRYGHVLFPSLHPPVVQLSRLLLDKISRDHFQRVFYSDNGLTGVTSAIKMALQLYRYRHNCDTNLVVLTQQGCSHTDALGVLSDEGHYPSDSGSVSIQVPFISYQKGSIYIDCTDLLPIVSKIQSVADNYINNSSVTNMKTIYDINDRLIGDLSEGYRSYITQFLDNISAKSPIGVLLIEPLMLGTAGMKFIDPLFQRILVEEVKARNISIIFDEVLVGLNRLGYMTTCKILQVYPDIAVYGNMLTGGYLPLTVTLASEETYNSYSKSTKSSKILGENNFTANPISCVAALEAIRLLETCPLYDPNNKVMNNSFIESDVKILSKLPGVKSVMTLGSVLAISLHPNINVATVVNLLRDNRILAQPLNEVIYLMPTPFATLFEKERLIRVMNRCLTNAYYIRTNN